MTVEANKTKEVVAKETALCNEQEAEAKGIKEECEAELAVAIPALNDAIKALNTLKKSDIVEVKSMKTPPGGVKLTMQAICIFYNVKPEMVKDPNGGMKKVPNYWDVSKKKLLGDTKFLDKLKKFDKDAISDKVIAKVKVLTDNPDFTPEKILKQSVAAS